MDTVTAKACNANKEFTKWTGIKEFFARGGTFSTKKKGIIKQLKEKLKTDDSPKLVNCNIIIMPYFCD